MSTPPKRREVLVLGRSGKSLTPALGDMGWCPFKSFPDIDLPIFPFAPNTEATKSEESSRKLRVFPVGGGAELRFVHVLYLQTSARGVGEEERRIDRSLLDDDGGDGRGLDFDDVGSASHTLCRRKSKILSRLLEEPSQ